MAYSLLRDVNSNTQDWRVRVRIARFWDHLNPLKNNELVRFQFVMVDEKGCAMQGSIAKDHIERFRGRLLEGHAYYLHYLEVKQARDAFRSVEHGFEAWLTKWTDIVEITPVPESLPRYAYKLRSFQNILANVGDKTYLADVIGIVTGVSSLVSIDVKGHSTSKCTLYLTDTRDTATVALWGRNAESIDSGRLIEDSSREPVVALIMGCTHKKQDSMLELSASYGSQVCINMDIPDIVALCDRLVGSHYPIELIMERGRRYESDEIQVVTMPEMSAMNPHVASGKRFRSKIVIDGVQPNKGWWFLSCDDCNCKAYEEGSFYRCSRERCSCKSASPRFCLPVVASGDGASVEMVFFGDVARDLVGKPAEVLVAENCSLISNVPAEIASLTGRSYVVDVSVSRYSFRTEDIRFQVLKLYPPGSSGFVGLEASLIAAGKAPQQLGDSSQSSPCHKIGSGNVRTQAVSGASAQAVSGASADDTVLRTPPPPAIVETPSEKHPVDIEQCEDLGGDDSGFPLGNASEKKEGTAKRVLFTEATEKPGKKNARKHK
ncbi:hypothetical protein ACQ4PT_042946 [Festuca glaucescens]